MDSTRSKGQSAILTTDRLILRRWRDSDRHPFARMNADSRVMEFFATRLSQKEAIPSWTESKLISMSTVLAYAQLSSGKTEHSLASSA
jgi:RimJ/RimL family protein N-acetyltransferase